MTAVTFEDQRYAWTRRRSVRRRGVAAEVALHLVLLAATLGAAAAGDRTAGLVLAAVCALWLVVFVPVHALVNLGVRGLHERRADTLDEVQVKMRERSTSAVTAVRLVLSLAAVVVAVVLATWAGAAWTALLAGFTLWMASWLTSTWHLAWTLPEERGDD